ncbi:MAG: cation diffusion facilitator family transporter [Candidatus Promineifilaceae bacterium]|nr:cation diffusion facilitator family transporter [Candidatus Promineifilaceae bacterium]
MTRYAWLSVAAGASTFVIKLAAAAVSGSVGLLSDALEAIVNLVAASIALIVLKIVQRPPDDSHPFGHDKAEYFSSGIESTLIVIAALGILYTAVRRLLNLEPLEQAGLGLALATAAALINLAVGQLLIRVGKKNDSITLESNGRHMMTDVWTSVGVLVGVGLSVMTGLLWLDPIIAIIVGLKIGWDGIQIFNRSIHGLMDSAIAPQELALIEEILNQTQERERIRWHALRTRQAGARRFIEFHLLVPGKWPVVDAHNLVERLEAQIHEQINFGAVLIHIEPLEDERSWTDQTLDSHLEAVDNSESEANI